MRWLLRKGFLFIFDSRYEDTLVLSNKFLSFNVQAPVVVSGLKLIKYTWLVSATNWISVVMTTK